MKRVKFDGVDVILYYNQVANENGDDWMQHARDRVRFRMRVKKLEIVLQKVLENKVSHCMNT